MSTFKMVDCQGLGGGLTLGIHQAGFDVVGKHEQPGGFGFAQVEDNRHLLGDFPLDDASPLDWYPQEADLLAGCPPCSGFSSLSIRAGGRDMRGVSASINHCMHDLIEYAGRCYPKVIAMESVQAAGKMGLPLMRQLRDELVAATGHGWYLTHVFHNALSVGGPSMRKRYFLVLSRIAPFGIGSPSLTAIPNLGDVIGDLEPLPLQWEDQGRVVDPGWWARRKAVDAPFVSGHALPKGAERWLPKIRGTHNVGWPEGMAQTTAAEHYWNATGGTWDRETGEILTEGKFPDEWDSKAQDSALYRPVEKAADLREIAAGNMTEDEYKAKWRVRLLPDTTPFPFITNMYDGRRWYWDKPPGVFDGGCMTGRVHPHLPRTLTYREAARVMGFPDSWNVRSYQGQESVFGKAVTADVGFWLGFWLNQHLQGTPDLWTGEETEPDVSYLERTIDITHDWQQVLDTAAGEKKRKEIAGRPA